MLLPSSHCSRPAMTGSSPVSMTRRSVDAHRISGRGARTAARRRSATPAIGPRRIVNAVNESATSGDHHHGVGVDHGAHRVQVHLLGPPCAIGTASTVWARPVVEQTARQGLRSRGVVRSPRPRRPALPAPAAYVTPLDGRRTAIRTPVVRRETVGDARTPDRSTTIPAPAPAAPST